MDIAISLVCKAFFERAMSILSLTALYHYYVNNNTSIIKNDNNGIWCVVFLNVGHIWTFRCWISSRICCERSRSES